MIKLSITNARIHEWDASKYQTFAATCEDCGTVNLARVTSGMSEAYPHFYCDTCSNVFHFEKYKHAIHTTEDPEAILHRIEAELPACPCGGRFRPGSNPNCRNCGREFVHQHSPALRLTDPYMVISDGCYSFNDDGDTGLLKIINYKEA